MLSATKAQPQMVAQKDREESGPRPSGESRHPGPRVQRDTSVGARQRRENREAAQLCAENWP